MNLIIDTDCSFDDCLAILLLLLYQKKNTNKLKLDLLSLVLVIVGGLNWGLVGLLNFNLVTTIFGQTVLTTIVYLLVGLSAVYLAVVSVKLERK